MIKRYRSEWEEYIEGLGTFYYNIKNSSIPELNGSIPSARDLAYVIIKTEKEISGPVKEGLISCPGEGNVLIRDFSALASGLMEEAAKAHAEGREFYIDKNTARKYVDKAKRQPENDEAIFLRNNFPIQTSKFLEDKRIEFLFGDTKKDIADALEKKKIKAIFFYADSIGETDKHDGPYANQLWMSLFTKAMPGFSGIYKHLHMTHMIHAIEKDPITVLNQ